MKIFLNIFFVFLLMANVSAETPNWVEHPNDDCYAGYLCRVGSGDTPGKAIDDAKNGIIVVVDPSNSTINRSNTPEIDQFLNSVYDEINTEKSYSKNMKYFSFALISLDTIRDKIRQTIDKIDTEVSALGGDSGGDSKSRVANLKNLKDSFSLKLKNLKGNSSERMPIYINKKI